MDEELDDEDGEAPQDEDSGDGESTVEKEAVEYAVHLLNYETLRATKKVIHGYDCSGMQPATFESDSKAALYSEIEVKYDELAKIPAFHQTARVMRLFKNHLVNACIT